MTKQSGNAPVTMTPLLRYALETLAIYSEPPRGPYKAKRAEWYRARDEVAKWLDSIEPRVVERPEV